MGELKAAMESGNLKHIDRACKSAEAKGVSSEQIKAARALAEELREQLRAENELRAAVRSGGRAKIKDAVKRARERGVACVNKEALLAETDALKATASSAMNDVLKAGR